MDSELLGRVCRMSVVLALGVVAGAGSGCADLFEDMALVEAEECNPGETRACEGECPTRPGTQTCGARGWGACEGAGVIETEVCNGRDDDCDGRVDESYPEEGETCSADRGECRPGRVACVEGFLQCRGGVQPAQEICNGLDDDCDGQVDEELSESLCYTGPEETRGLGICHAGVLVCRDGRGECVGQQLPMAADCSNGLDNNCDGYLDPPQEEPRADIVLLVDKSGSMILTIEALRRALDDLLHTMRQWDEVRVAIVAVPGSLTTSDCVVETGFVAPERALGIVNSLTTDGGAREPTLDCAMGIAHPTAPLGLEWAPEAKRIAVLFSDETCQSPWCESTCGQATTHDGAPHWCNASGFAPDHRLAVEEATEALVEAEVQMEVFTTERLGAGAETGFYRPLADQTGGGVHDLGQSVEDLAGVIQKVLMASVCE